jgi:hypothetical protein
MKRGSLECLPSALTDSGPRGTTMNRIALAFSICALLQACSREHDNNAGQTFAPEKTATLESRAPAISADAEIPKDDTEHLFQNPFDPDAVYFLSQKNGTAHALNVLIKRDSQAGTQYSRWQFNCVDRTARNFGVTANIQDLSKSTNSTPSALQRYEAKSRLGAIASAVCP